MRDSELNDEQLRMHMSSVVADLTSIQDTLWQCYVSYSKPDGDSRDSVNYYNYIRENIYHIHSLIEDVIEEVREDFLED